MRATTETRRTLLFVATLLLTPPILWGVFGLMERFPPRRAFSGESTSPRDYQQVSKIRMVRDQLKWAGNQEKWEMIPPLVQREFGNDCPFELLPLRAEALWHLGNRSKAVTDWDLFYGSESPLSHTESLALRGETREYARFCEHLLTLAPVDGVEANNRAWVMVLLPKGLKDYGTVIAMAERGVAQAKNADERSIYLNTLGVALLRAGRLQEALEQLRLSEKLHSQPANWPFFSLIYRELKQPEQAQRWKKALAEYLRKSYGNSTDPRHELLLFQKEL